jgi:hypothetical protein
VIHGNWIACDAAKMKYLLFLLVLIAIGIFYESSRSAREKAVARLLFILLILGFAAFLAISWRLV